MNEQTTDLRSVKLESIFKRSNNCVNLRHGQVIGQRAMAAHLNTIMHPRDHHLMNVENLGKAAGRAGL